MEKIEAKKNLRTEIRKRMDSLDDDYCERASQIITQKVLASAAYQDVDTVFCFVGMQGEPDTMNILEDALSKGKRVCVPLCVAEGVMETREIKDLRADLKKGYFGILEPSPTLPKVEADEIDFAILPCVTCDHRGNRLGHGKGYYDRFLRGTRFATCMICFEKLVSEEIPMDEYDQKADSVVTDAE